MDGWRVDRKSGLRFHGSFLFVLSGLGWLIWERIGCEPWLGSVVYWGKGVSLIGVLHYAISILLIYTQHFGVSPRRRLTFNIFIMWYSREHTEFSLSLLKFPPSHEILNSSNLDGSVSKRKSPLAHCSFQYPVVMWSSTPLFSKAKNLNIAPS